MDYKQIYSTAAAKAGFMDGEGHLKIYIGSSLENCTAADISSSFQSEIEKRGLLAKIIPVGPSGYFDLEPLVRVEKPDNSSILYHNVTPQMSPGLVNDWLTGEISSPDMIYCRHDGGTSDNMPDYSSLPIFSLQNRIALRNCGYINPDDIGHYIIASKGYSGLVKSLQITQAKVIEMIGQSDLKDDSDGSSIADQWQRYLATESPEKYVVCNAINTDPENLAPSLLLESDPHSILEGILIGAYAIGASHCIICININNKIATQRLKNALAQMREYSLLGSKILESNFSCEIEIREMEASLVLDDDSALLNYLQQNQPMPDSCITPIISFMGKPALVNGVETFAKVSAILQDGPGVYSSTGTEHGRGTKIVTLTGTAVHKYTVEIPLGITLRNLVTEIGGGVLNGVSLKAVQFGGPTGALFPLHSLDIPIGYESMKEAGSLMGSGTATVFTGDSCAVGIVRETMDYIQTQSCGKCVFCREGTFQITDILKNIDGFKGEPAVLELLCELGEEMRVGSLCRLGQNAPNPVLSSIKHFAEDFHLHIKEKKCLESNISPQVAREAEL